MLTLNSELQFGLIEIQGHGSHMSYLCRPPCDLDKTIRFNISSFGLEAPIDLKRRRRICLTENKLCMNLTP